MSLSQKVVCSLPILAVLKTLEALFKFGCRCQLIQVWTESKMGKINLIWRQNKVVHIFISAFLFARTYRRWKEFVLADSFRQQVDMEQSCWHFHRIDKVYSLKWINYQTSCYILIIGTMCLMFEAGVLSWQRNYVWKTVLLEIRLSEQEGRVQQCVASLRHYYDNRVTGMTRSGQGRARLKKCSLKIWNHH